MTDWPASIVIGSTVDRQSYREQTETNRVAFQPAVGPDKVRRRSTLSGARMSFTLWLTGAQVATLETFYRTTLADGTLPFTMTHPRTGVDGTFRFDASAELDISKAAYDLYQVSVQLRKVS